MAEHASISRFHAVIQHSQDGGVYVYDLGSTHGSKINKTPLTPKYDRVYPCPIAYVSMPHCLCVSAKHLCLLRTYTRLPIGQLVRFGMRYGMNIVDSK